MLADRVTKLLAATLLAGYPAIDLLGGTVKLVYQENRGAMLGLGAELPEPVRFWVFTVLIGILLVGLAGYALFRGGIRIADLLAASLVIGGGGGNMIDRIVFHGAVVDFVTIGAGAFRTGVFNVADIAIIAGVAVFAFHRWRLSGEGGPRP